MSKFRFWRMEEPAAPSWAGEGSAERLVERAPPVDPDVAFQPELRMDGVVRSIFGWMYGHPAAARPRLIAAASSMCTERSRAGASDQTTTLHPLRKIRRTGRLRRWAVAGRSRSEACLGAV